MITKAMLIVGNKILKIEACSLSNIFITNKTVDYKDNRIIFRL